MRFLSLIFPFLFLFANEATADGFGWYATPFRYEAMTAAFGRDYIDDKKAQPLKQKALKAFDDATGEGSELLPRFEKMLREGWHRNPSLTVNDEQWLIFSMLSSEPQLLPEFEFGQTSELISMDAIFHAQEHSPAGKNSLLRHFMFGRQIHSSEAYKECPGVHSSYFVAPGNCSPVHIILNPGEVAELNKELAAVLKVPMRGLKKGSDRYYMLVELHILKIIVGRAAKKKAALFLQGHD